MDTYRKSRESHLRREREMAFGSSYILYIYTIVILYNSRVGQPVVFF